MVGRGGIVAHARQRVLGFVERLAEHLCLFQFDAANLAPVSLTGRFRRVLGLYFAVRGVSPVRLGNIGNMVVLFSIVVNKPDYQFSL